MNTVYSSFLLIPYQIEVHVLHACPFKEWYGLASW